MANDCPDDLRHEFADTLARFWALEGEPAMPESIREWPMYALLLGSFARAWLDDEWPDADSIPDFPPMPTEYVRPAA